MARPNQQAFNSALPVYQMRRAWLTNVNNDSETYPHALILTCPRTDCRRQYALLDDPGTTQTRACPYCFKTARQP